MERCGLCGSGSFVGIAQRDRYDFRVSADACTNCGLVFLNPLMTSQSYKAFYESVYRPLVSAYHGRRIDQETIQSEQREYATRLSANLAPFLGAFPARTLLDIGGSTGVVAHRLASDFQLRATVIDPAPLELEEARRLGLETVRATAESYDSASRTFDVILMCQTVDHLLDISSSFRAVRRLLHPEGIFFVDMVDFRAAYLRNWGVEKAIKVDHPYYLTEPVMEALLGREGFSVLRKDYEADHLHVSYVCRPSEPEPVLLPSRASVELLLREIRFVQSARPAGAPSSP